MTAARPRVSFDMHRLLENFYQSRLLLLLPEFSGFPASFTDRLLEFVAREKPMGAIVLVASEPEGDVPAAGSIEPAYALSGMYDYSAVPYEAASGGLDYGSRLLSHEESVLAHS
jgi:hypothetical protein